MFVRASLALLLVVLLGVVAGCTGPDAPSRPSGSKKTTSVVRPANLNV